ncbi:Cation-transporting P-type ATPase (ZntA) (PDB:4BBJ) [Commensalibacter communis]|uniref:P-type Zn(2+) transporter n=1 Tax=Commensalibacter communis TaxID=2972786 RepID=A0A9W4TJN5_9PROT|nr:heavy metal translocating P-type ATPase [Commensalibacter communis]CAI3922205.1 Cation-transporting P-type ATPase (ZntA) (PDB:4BBJ) [Commensalibacter communis]CAI3923118.1 Cation-transporting P-type ATPase (ZntA) (PDB:4BBJ) [Commensalibacter communis]CAI3939379.1 Cation-transporting P-type ATPase (ZntA) (PDB:4BBJ) [Commensalibacter communis]CAI3939957.1 Cation-transporting P-type ATPase (ZntA) (PDB:4BBJ) [Commensalibacter communis]
MVKDVNKHCHCDSHDNHQKQKNNHNHNLHDHNHSHDHTEVKEHQHGDDCCSSKPQSLTELSESKTIDGFQLTQIRIMQMDCPVEENIIRKKLGEMKAVKELHFNLIQRVLTVTHRPDALDSILAVIRQLDFEPEIYNKNDKSPQSVEHKKQYWLLILASLAAILAEITHFMKFPWWVQLILALIAVAACGIKTYKKGWISIRNFDLNINALMSIAVTGALILGQWPEAAMVMVLFNIAELIEAKSLDRARNAISSLMNLTPNTTMVQQQDGSWQETEVSSVKINDIIKIKPGERIGLDGIITHGQTTINQAPITGESLPIDKSKGDQIFAGTINETGLFEYSVTSLANDSTIARIIHAVEEAQANRAPIQRFVDRFSRIYTPTVLLIALIIAILPPMLHFGTWSEWIYKALIMLVIACPCALVISTPITIVSGLTLAARRGILVKGGVYLELGRQLKYLALDKTGTITHGKPIQTNQVIYGELDPNQGFTLAASLANNSNHPISQAVAKAASDLTLYTVEQFEEVVGKGIKGVVQGQIYYLGNLRLTNEIISCDEAIKKQVEQFENQGKTVILLNNGQQILGLFAIADTIKDSSQEAINELHQLGVKTVMLTGDNASTAQAIAKEVGIDEARGNQLPQDKYDVIVKYSRQGTTGMVGDGINDAPALAAARIGFAMGSLGTDTAIETADVALMDDDLRKIPEFIRLSKRTHNVIIQNISFALGIKLVFLVLTFIGMGTMWMAVFADVGASLLVVANGLRLLKN